MSSDAESKETNTALKAHELMQILQKGTCALARWEADSVDKGLSAFLSSSIGKILARSKQTEDLRDFKVKQEAGEAMEDKKLAFDLEEEERKLLSGIAQVQTRLFEGRHHQKEEEVFTEEWTAMQKRARVDRLVVVNGVQSIPMEAAAVTKLQPLKRNRGTWEHEEYCIGCRDGGDLICCQFCPRVCEWHRGFIGLNTLKGQRSVHAACLGFPRNAHRLPSVRCSQHACVECGRKASEAGGMLFRRVANHGFS